MASDDGGDDGSGRAAGKPGAAVVNLRQFRKRKNRAAARAAGDANAAAHGVSRSARDLAAAKRAKDAARLDAHRRDPSDDKSEPEG